MYISAYRGRYKRRKRTAVIPVLFFIMAAGLAVTGIFMLAALKEHEIPARPVSEPDSPGSFFVSDLDSIPEITDIPDISGAERDNIPLIAIDAGHGGMDGGTSAGGIPEKTFNLEIAQKLRDILESQGYRVLMIRNDDEYVEKGQRAAVANEAGASLFISIHQNSDSGGAHGIETWYDDTETEKDCYKLALLVQSCTVWTTGARDRGLRTSHEMVVIRETAMPSCLIETGFVSNGEELKLLASAEYQTKIARGIAEGIHWYINPNEPLPGYDDPPVATPDSVKAIGWGLSFRESGDPPDASCSPEYLSQFDAVYLGDVNQKRLYLTFDAGYENGCTASILDTLAYHDVPAAFFLVGHYIQANHELVRRMNNEGHIVANHTFNHADMAAFTELEDFKTELSELEELYKAVTEADLARYYRPPEGEFSELNLRQAQYLGYRTVFWSLAYVDWEQNQPTRQQALDKLLPRVHPGAVILLHSTSQTNAEILNELLTIWKSEGYTFGSIDELFDREADNRNTLYLTFDDGPSAKYTETILDELKARGIKATFFVVGENVRKYPELVCRIADEGHTIGIHCYSHAYNEIYASVESYVADFEKALNIVEETIGVKPNLFRFPGGSINAYNKGVFRDIIEAMAERGYIYFDWNASLEDAVRNPQADLLLKSAKNSVGGKNAAVLLAHDTVSVTAQILPELLDMFAEYKFELLTSNVAPVRFRYD